MEGIGFAFLIAALFPFLIILLLISLLALLPLLFGSGKNSRFLRFLGRVWLLLGLVLAGILVCELLYVAIKGHVY